MFLNESGGEVGYASRVSRACPESSTLRHRRELGQMRRPKGGAEGKGKAGPLEARRGKYSLPANPERVTLEPLKRRNSGVTS